MGDSLADIFEAVAAPDSEQDDRPVFAVLPVPGFESCFVGKDRESRACLLIVTAEGDARPPPPIRLESLDAQFALRCHLKKGREPAREGTFTVIRCRLLDRETVRYFLSVCQTILRMIGEQPSQQAVSAAVQRLAAILQNIKSPPARTLNGLFGELFLISRSGNPARALAAWRIDEHARFDFSDGDVRLDVKATGGRVRVHSFSYDQCNPPPGTIAIAASLFVEHAPGGVTIRALTRQIEERIASEPDLVLKLHEIIAGTLGSELNEALSVAFDPRIAESSLRFFDICDIPALHDPLPAGVSDVRFRSDLSAVSEQTVRSLIDRAPVFWDLLPRPDDG